MIDPPKPVAAAIIIQEGKVLVTRRAPGQTLEGYWEFPGGKVAEGESVQECIVRELAEELSIEVTAGEVFTENLYRYPRGSINLIAVHTQMEAQDLILSVHDAFDWRDPRQLLDLKLAPADIPIAEALIEKHHVLVNTSREE